MESIHKLKDSNVKKRILYTACFVMLCIIDQIKNSAGGRVQFVAMNCTGFVVAVIILSAYQCKDFLKIPYLVWSIVFVAGGVTAYLWGRGHYAYMGRWITGILNVGIYGYIVIRLLYKFVADKASPRLNKPFFIVWLVIMAGMIFSRNDSVWPLWFLVMFGSFYLTEFTTEDVKILFGSMIDGIIISFFLIQGAAFVFRPYDTLRYLGMFANSNINALFYTVSYGAFLCKWYQLKVKKAPWILRAATVCFAGAMYGFTLLTMGRTAVLAMGAVTIVFLLFLVVLQEKHRVKKFIGGGLAILLTAVISFPLVFGCVRYLPPLFHHPIWFEGEYSETKVHSWDPIDSEKYTELDEVIENSIGRFLWFLDYTKEEARRLLGPTLVVYAADQQHPLLTDPADNENSAKIRKNIYQYYLHQLNLTGHKNEEHGLWVTEDYYAPHAHNILLQFSFDFGIGVGILFAVIIAWIYYTVIKMMRHSQKEKDNFLLLVLSGFTTIFVVFGMLEIDWRVGQTIFTLFYMLLYLMCHKISDGETVENSVVVEKKP